jgi:hypothetical protein
MVPRVVLREPLHLPRERGLPVQVGRVRPPHRSL